MAVYGPVGKMGNISTPDVLAFELDRKVCVWGVGGQEMTG